MHRSQLIISNKYGHISSQAKTWTQITSGPASQKYGEFIKSIDEQFNPNTQKSEREETVPPRERIYFKRWVLATRTRPLESAILK